jgi:hypothetical protein
MSETETRSIYTIAAEISADWKKVNFAAVPYLGAMLQLDKASDNFGCDSARSVCTYFLANAGSWRGETARRIKKELKAIIN